MTTSVRQAWALERDRLYAEIAELRDEVHVLTANFYAHLGDKGLQHTIGHSVRVDP